MIGTVLMLIGGNSRQVAADVGERLEEINQTLPPGIRANPVLDRTGLVDKTIATVEHNLFFGAILVIVVLFALLGNIRAALLTAMAIPLSMLLTATGMVQAGITANLLSLGAIDFGIIIDGSVIIVENCVRRLAERQHELGRKLTLRERLDTTFEAAKQVRTATAFGEAIIITVYLPVLFLTGVEGKMFTPMAATVIFALVGAFVLSLTFIPAAVAIVMRGKVSEKEVFLLRWSKAAYAPIVRGAVRGRWAVTGVAVVAFVGSLFLFTRLGQEFVPQLDEGDIAMHAMRIPSTGLTSSQDNQFMLERKIAEIPEVKYVFSKTGTAELAADPMRAERQRQLHHPRTDGSVATARKRWSPPPKKPRRRWATLTPAKRVTPTAATRARRTSLVRLVRAVVATVPGNNYEFTQPIEMRFNELISGVRSDVAVKVFGDDFNVMLPAANDIAAVLQDIPGATDVKVEQTEGLPVLDVQIDRAAISRLGLNVREVQDLVAAAVGRTRDGADLPGRPPLRPDRPTARSAARRRDGAGEPARAATGQR